MDPGTPPGILFIHQAASGGRGSPLRFFPPLIPGYFQACVRRRAVLSVAANPACPDVQAAENAVNEVWDSCFPDTRPFDEVGVHCRQQMRADPDADSLSFPPDLLKPSN